MESKLTTLTFTDKGTLVNQLIQAGYAFAAWSMPQSKEINMIISLSEAQQTQIPLSELSSGFLLNAFDCNHPIKPYHIASDIVIKQDQISIDPRIQSSQIDSFFAGLSETKNEIGSKSIFQENIQLNSSSSIFENTVQEAIEEIKNGTFEKIVLSRTKEQLLPKDFNVWDLLTSVNESYPNAFCSLSFIPGKGVWIGATPELLLSDNQERFKTVSLAGTKKLSEHQNLSDIAWTQKEIEEQAFVSRYIINCFKKIRLREFHEHGPKTIKAGSLAHLKTEFEVKYGEVNFDNLAEQMLELLHPTSAVCGMPIELVKPWIATKENYDREFYAGFLGPVHFEGETDLFVNLRCVKVDNGVIKFYAGAGITEDSDPIKEFEETELKMNVLKSLI